MATDRYVRMNIMQRGADEAEKKLDILRDKSDELEKPRTIRLAADDDDAKAKLEDVKVHLALLTDRTHDIKIDAKDHAALASIERIKIDMDKLDHKTANPEIKVRGVDESLVKVLSLEAAMDRLDRKNSGGGKTGILSNIGSILKGSVGGGEEGSGFLSSPVGIGLLTGGAIDLAGTIPGIVGQGIGSGIAGGGLGIAALTNQGFAAKLGTLEGSLKNIGAMVTQPLATAFNQLTPTIMKDITQMEPMMTKMFSASIPFMKQFMMLLLQAGKILMPAFTQAMQEMVKSGALKEMTQGLLLVITGLAGFVKALGPGMKDGAQVFERLMLAVHGILIGLGVTVTWVAKILEFDYPGAVEKGAKSVVSSFLWMWGAVKDSAEASTKAVLNDIKSWAHDVASVFDDLRHDIASIWDSTWHDTVGRLEDGIHQSMSDLDNWRHDISSTFDNIRHDVASIWDSMWGGLKSVTRDAIHDLGSILHGIESIFLTPFEWVVNHAFKPLAGVWDAFAKDVGLPQIHVSGFASGGKINAGTGPTSDDVLIRASKGETVVSAAHSQMLAPVFKAAGIPGYAGGGIIPDLFHIGTGILDLLPGGSTLVKEIEKGATSLAIKGFEAATAGALGTSGPGGMFRDALDTVASAAIKALSGAYQKTESAAGKYGNAPPGSGPYQAYARKLFPRFGWGPGQFAPFNAIVMQESGWNPNAQNPTSSAYGIGQFLNSTWASVGGHKTSNPYLQIFYMEEYIKQRYGDPSNAESYHLAHNSYGFGGVINEPVFGLGLHTGQSYQFGELGPETVTPGRHSGIGGDTYNINITVDGDTNPDAAAIRIMQIMRRYKKKHGNQETGIG